MRLSHVPVLDAIRGIAILLVLAVHADHRLPGGILGVDLFFVLSGFLITSLLLTEWDRDGSISLRSFYRRRGLRLLPAVVVMLAIVTAIAALTVDDFGGQFVWVLYSLGYVINLAALGNGIGAENLQHMWSLSQEEQFYLVWPLALIVLLKKGVHPRMLAFALAGLAVALLVYRGVLGATGVSAGYLLYAPETRSVGLVLGCLAGVLFSYGFVRRVPLLLPTALLVPACFAVAVLGLYSRSDAIVFLPLFCIAAAVVLLACVLHPDWWFARLVDRAWLRGLGKISYGLYLWHVPIYVAVGWMAGLPLAIFVAVLSYRYVEQPFLRRRHPSPVTRRDRPASAPAEPIAAPAVQPSSA
ncbi:MAG: acyltransferase family protein [Gaiellaceae bacterium]